MPNLENERFREVADAAPVGLWRINADFEQDWVNKHWLDFTGGRLEEEVGFRWVDRIHPDDRERVVEEFDRAFEARKATQVEFRLQGRDGSYRWFLDAGAPLYRSGEFAGFVGTCTDITDRKRVETHLAMLKAELLEKTGDGASDVLHSFALHELNHALLAVTTHTDALQTLLASRTEMPSEIAEAAASAGRSAHHAREMVRDTQTAIANGKEERRRLDLSSALRSLEPVIRGHPAAAGVQVTWDLAKNLLVQISRSDIQNALLRLAERG
ncbi:MAG: hypothetical protein AVDCRST_MAG93-7117, partial [uncultured Chloroflexia bacterium]